MTFEQWDFNLNRFKYIIEGTGVRIINKRLFSSGDKFVSFEDIGSKTFKVKERKLVWLITSILFLFIALIVFINRIRGDKVANTAEVFHLSISTICFVIYLSTRKNSLFLVQDSETNGIEFIGTIRYEKQLGNFIKQLLQKRDDYLGSKYPSYDGLTISESIFCSNAHLQPKDGLFLKKLTKHHIEKVVFEVTETQTEKLCAICSVTTEKNARRILNEHQERFISEGKYIYICEFADDGYKIGLIGTTSDPYKIMEYSGTNGVNFDIETKDIIQKYKQWDKQFGIKVVGIGADFCECEIINKNIDYKKLASEVHEFCPDVVEQGTKTVELLEQEMKRTGRIFLWWD